MCSALIIHGSYSESELDSNFVDNSSKSESEYSSVFMNLDICIFFILYLHSFK